MKIEIANETIKEIAQMCQACNYTFWNKIKVGIINELNIRFGFYLFILNFVMLLGLFLGWFWAGYYRREKDFFLKRKHK